MTEVLVESKPSPKRVLLVDDDSMLRDSIVRILEMEGFNVITSGSGKDGTEVIIQQAKLGKPIDVVVCDYDLGRDVPNGTEVVTQMTEYSPMTRFIIFSGLQRFVPEGVEFVLKDSFDKLMEAIARD